MKIGQEIVITSDLEIKTAFGEVTIPVKAGDEGYVDSSGFVHYISGKARGKIQAIKDCEVEGYDHENIAKLIFKRLDSCFHIGDRLEDYELSEKDLVNEIEDILCDIL